MSFRILRLVMTITAMILILLRDQHGMMKTGKSCKKANKCFNVNEVHQFTLCLVNSVSSDAKII